LLYLAFIENAFKHGSKEKSDQPFIHISFNLAQEDRVVFQVENRIDPFIPKNQEGGFGLANVKKRLELLYPGRHTLTINETLTIYQVELIIYLS
jgi:LytS/YehU family sensor histidine kinase